MEISLTPDSVAMRSAVSAALAEFFDATRSDTRLRPGLPDDPFTLSRSWISETISTVAGEVGHVLASPADDIVFQPGELPVLGEITWS